MSDHFDILIVVTPADCERVLPLYPRLVSNFDNGKICFIGSEEVGKLVRESAIADHALWIDENDIIPFDDVHACMARRLEPILNGEKLPRGVTGWYYQQFLKMQYAYRCTDKYYMVWDGDTIPCRKINMFSQETGQPYLDLKHEYHAEYFDTLGKLLPGFGKVIERSFISEHMLFNCEIMKKLIADIESNDSIEGTRFWEKIINAIEPDKMQDSSFSEFETYGTYVALRYPNEYRLREWHSFRLGASFYEIDTITDGDFKWLGVDFDAISFEKGQSVLDANRGYFDNPEVQKKISAKKLLQAAQMEYKDGYKEVWEDDITAQNANVRSGSYGVSQERVNEKTIIMVKRVEDEALLNRCTDSIKELLNDGTYSISIVDDNAASINAAVRQCDNTDFAGADVFILNGNCSLIFDSLYFLKQALYGSEDIGAVGSLSNSADNKQQVDIKFDTLEEYIKYGEQINVPTASPCLEKVKLSGFALLIKRKAWDELGGLTEDTEAEGAKYDVLSLRLLERGYRLQLVRNSFIYSEPIAGDVHGSATEESSDYVNHKFGFDLSIYAHASGKAISQIPYNSGDRFAVLHFGCGLGAELKVIRSLFPNTTVYGVENNRALYGIVKKTEKVFESLDELLDVIDDQFFSVMIIDGKVYQDMAAEERDMLTSLLMPEHVLILKD
ncbi:MAG: hypothetical protein J5959_19510 [Butyrivibrio sp.]|nr:hypothetical protein [Butyrivibrio sp.]